MNYLNFYIGNEMYGIDASVVLNISELPKITEIPKMPHYIVGATFFRDGIISVIDGRKRLKIDSKVTNPNLIVFEKDDKKYGFIVDKVDDMIDCDSEMDKKIENVFISGIIKHNDDFIMVLDIDKIVDY